MGHFFKLFNTPNIIMVNRGQTSELEEIVTPKSFVGRTLELENYKAEKIPSTVDRISTEQMRNMQFNGGKDGRDGGRHF